MKYKYSALLLCLITITLSGCGDNKQETAQCLGFLSGSLVGTTSQQNHSAIATFRNAYTEKYKENPDMNDLRSGMEKYQKICGGDLKGSETCSQQITKCGKMLGIDSDTVKKETSKPRVGEKGFILDIGCYFNGQRMTIYPCIPAQSTVKVETSEGSKVYSGYDLHQNGGSITVPEHFRFVAQNEDDALILKLEVYDIATETITHRDQAGHFGLVSASH